MALTRRVAFACFAATALLSIVFGIVYLVSPQIMPYHLAAMGTSWPEIPQAHQVVLLAILRVAGGGFITTGVAITSILVRPFREGASWAPYALLAVGLSMALPAAYAVWMVTSRTNGRPPWAAALGGIVLIVVGFTAAVASRPRAARPTRHAA